METVKIIECGLMHLDALVNLSWITFQQTYENFNQAENFAQYLEANFSTEKIKAELENPASQYFLAQDEDNVIGYLKTNLAPAQTDLNDPLSLEIERIYVLKSHHGKNIGKLLVDCAVEVAIKHQLQYIWLGVWEKNTRAIRFYEKQGFRKFGTHIFQLGDDPQEDYLMKLLIS